MEDGAAVTGAGHSGEVTISKRTETIYEDKYVQKEVCNYEYDVYQDRDVYKCRFKAVPERQPVTKTTYIVIGAGLHTEHSNVLGAFSYAGAVGAYRFRYAT